jgi:predicted 2-oxoglutarate/Fe(II)-dependent dioxygenase YbiX
MNAEMFATFGMYVRKQFLDADFCHRVVAEVRASASRPATVREDGAQTVDETYRRSHLAVVSEPTVALVHQSVVGLTADLERHFRIATTACRRPEFLVYRRGDFFSPHADSVRAGSSADEVVTRRRLTIVVFLNDESDIAREGVYRGGSLDFYGLIPDRRMKNRALSLTGEAGLLVAFPAETMHGVSPVITGERYTVVTWFEG